MYNKILQKLIREAVETGIITLIAYVTKKLKKRKVKLEKVDATEVNDEK